MGQSFFRSCNKNCLDKLSNIFPFQGLGQTVLALRMYLKSDPISKTQFSMVTDEVKIWLNHNDHIDTIVLCGIETRQG